ncbi:MAG TPA: hypothetical protein VH643_35835 [Gemmataceae bacterium]|jgi:hypothetical protein
MTVRIVVAKGPDQGKSCPLDARGETRIGRGPGNHLMVQDPAWQGSLRVSFSQGVCKVSNQTPTTIYLGGKPFPPGEQRPWFHGESLQPTAQTLLVLSVEDAAKAGAEGKAGAAQRKKIQLAIILLCLPVAALLFLTPTSTPPGVEEARTPEQAQSVSRKLETELQELQARADSAEIAAKILALLKEARFEQVRAHPAQAFKLYHRLRQEVETDLGTPVDPRPLPDELAQTLRRVRDFVNQQLIELGAEAKKRTG